MPDLRIVFFGSSDFAIPALKALGSGGFAPQLVVAKPDAPRGRGRKIYDSEVKLAAKELGPYGLLLRVSTRDELETFAQQTLRPLVEHDRAHGGELVHTLRAYLEENRVQRRVAERCFIHVNTVVYRVRRIEELLGVDLGDPAAVFDVTLALRILDLLGDEPVAAVELVRPS